MTRQDTPMTPQGPKPPLIPLFRRPSTGKFNTPPKKRRTSFVMPQSSTPRRPPKRPFIPIPVPLYSQPPASPKRKRARTGQVSPKKRKPCRTTPLENPFESETFGLGTFGSNFGDDGIFNDDFALPNNEKALPDEDEDLSVTIDRLEQLHEQAVPELWSALHDTPEAYVQLSPQCYLFQDWDYKRKCLKVYLVFRLLIS